MRSIFIDTSTERAIYALCEGGNVIFEKELPFGYNSSQKLMKDLVQSFDKYQFQLNHLSYISVGKGPGSYTGIRVGATVAKTLAYSLRIPLVGLCSLQGFIPKVPGKFAAMIDAKIGGVYLLLGELSQEKVLFSGEPELCHLDVLAKRLSSVEMIVCPVCSLLIDKLNQLIPERTFHWIERAPDAAYLSAIGKSSYINKKYSLDSSLELLYLRKTQAEIEKESLSNI